MNVWYQLRQKAENKFSVNPSPYNSTKFELGVIIAIMILLWIVVHFSTNNPLTQIAVLFVFSLLSAFWLVYRIKRIQKKISMESQSDD